MRALDVVVHASTRPEPFGLVIAEAMACGRAVITSGTGGAGELVRDGVDAVTHRPGDAVDLASRIERLAADAALRARLGRAARDTAERRFDAARLARRVREHVRGGPRRSAGTAMNSMTAFGLREVAGRSRRGRRRQDAVGLPGDLRHQPDGPAGHALPAGQPGDPPVAPRVGVRDQPRGVRVVAAAVRHAGARASSLLLGRRGDGAARHHAVQPLHDVARRRPRAHDGVLRRDVAALLGAGVRQDAGASRAAARSSADLQRDQLDGRRAAGLRPRPVDADGAVARDHQLLARPGRRHLYRSGRAR